jgi:hypothetical protein
MKLKYLNIIYVLLLLDACTFTANAQIRDYCLGEWNYRCPDVSEGFDTGIITITRDSVCTECPGIKNTFSTERIYFTNDTLSFKIEIDGQQIICAVTPGIENTLCGNLITSSGVFPIVLIKSAGALKN